MFPNKPYPNYQIARNTTVENVKARQVIEQLNGKKIILYQGIILKNRNERVLDKFIEAVDKLGDDYAFVVMTNAEHAFEGVNSHNFFSIPFVEPPLHLHVTSHAYIGILSYFAVYPVVLNVLYCAPNKTYEYGMFGIPMLSNDVPALSSMYDRYHAGICVDRFEVDDICRAILEIEKNYEEYSAGSKRFFDSMDIRQCFDNILHIVTERIERKNGV